MKRALAVALSLILIAIYSIGVVVYNQKNLIKQAQMLQIMGKPLMAVSLYERVLLNYVPFSPYNKQAVKGMENICLSLNDKKYKLFCEETLRSSFYQIRSFYTPYSEKIKQLDKTILLLKTELYIEHNKPPQDKYKTVYNELKTFQNYDYYPVVSWSLTAVLALLFWIGSLVFIIFKGFNNPANKRNLIAGLAGFIIFFLLWIVGLYMS